MTSVLFNVQGMHCAGCAQSIENRLLSTVGIESVTIDFAAGTANVNFDESLTNADSIEKIIESLGFDVVYSMGRG